MDHLSPDDEQVIDCSDVEWLSCDDPNGTPAWQRASELGADIAGKPRPKRSPELWRYLYLAPVFRERAARRVALPRRTPRARGGARRPSCRTSRTSSRSRAGPSDDSGSSPGDGEPPPPVVLYLVHEDFGRVSRRLARFLREAAP